MSRRGVGIRYLLIVTVFLSPQSFAQTSTATLRGTILDPSGAVVPGAQVTVRNVDTNVERQRFSNDIGEYVAPLLHPGEYEVVVEVTGFKKFVRSGIILQVNELSRVDVTLETGDVTEQVTVEADTSVLEGDNSTLGTVVAKQAVVELPLNGRDFYHLTYLVPGATSGAEGTQLATEGGNAVSVYGMREQNNNFLLDGVSNNTTLSNQIALVPSLDSIQEFKVQSGNYSAEFGTHAGAQVNFVTRSGSNLLSASLYEFHRNAVLDAKNYFAPHDLEIPKLIRNQFGFSVGGPIVKDRSFFFGNYEGLRERKAITKIATVPPPEFIQGDFSGLLPYRINDPNTGEPFPGNLISEESMDPIGAAIAAYYPSPSGSDSTFLSQPVRNHNVNQFMIRFDHQLTEQDSFFARYAFSDGKILDPFNEFTNLPGFGREWFDRGQNVALSWTRTISPQLLNDLRLGFTRRRFATFHETMGNDISSQLGIKGLSTNPLEVGFPATVVAGFDSLEEHQMDPHDRVDNNYQLTESVNWLKGRHVFKFGGDIRHIRANILFPIFARGRFFYTGMVSRHPVSDLLLGRATFVAAGAGDAHANLRNWSFALFFQDDFKISPSLTLNYGLRYEYSQPPFAVSNRLLLPDLDANPARYVTCGTEGIPRGCYEDDKNNFAPRLGVAWRPLSKSAMVLRAGYGIFYETNLFDPTAALWENPPVYENRQSYFPFSLADPFGTGFGPPSYAHTVTRDFPLAYAQQWSLSVQQRLADNLVEVGYMGTKGTKLLALSEFNQSRPGGQPPYPAYGGLATREAGASSIYHGLWVRAERRFKGGLNFLGSYTFAKSIDDASAYIGSTATWRFPQDSYNRGAERALSDFDNRHRLAFSYLWQLPIGQSRRYLSNANSIVEALLGGWQLTGILTLQSARPFTPVLMGTNDSNTSPYCLERPNLVGNPHLRKPDPALWVNPAAFERTCGTPPGLPCQQPGTFGDAGRNILRGPGFQSLDFALMKRWNFREVMRLQFRVEAFNLFNHPNFNLPEGDWNSPDFGRVKSAFDSRQIQLGLRLEF